MVLPEVGLAFLRMSSSPNLDDFQREDKLSGNPQLQIGVFADTALVIY